MLTSEQVCLAVCPLPPMLDTLGERDMVVVWVVRGKNIVPEQTWV